jgi:hypothetical protein
MTELPRCITPAFRATLVCLLALAHCLAWADDAPVPDKAKLQIVRSSGMMSMMAARLEVNGHRLGELLKGESLTEVVPPGRITVKIDNAYAPGMHIFSFTGEAYGVYRIDIGEAVSKATVEQTFGSPPRVANPVIVEDGGSLRATLSSAKVAPAPKPTEPPPPPPCPAAVLVATPVAPPSAAPAETAPDGAAKVEEQLRGLKRLFDQGLISADIYADKQRKLLDAMK